ncbi:MAG: hypothetical protein NVS3B20_04630 [Polyangiales bacterium]
MSLLRWGFGATSASLFVIGCGDSPPERPALLPSRPDQTPSSDAPLAGRYSDNVDALFDILIPAERRKDGSIIPGAREALADKVLHFDNFLPLAQAAGFFSNLPTPVLANLHGLGTTFRDALNADLDALSFSQKPLTAFRDLPFSMQQSVVDAAFADDARKPAMQIVRVACFTAYLGGVASDVGLRAIGFPPFENLSDGLAVSGYPRTRTGRLIDAAKENLSDLAAKNDLDDYTYNRAPKPTKGDALTFVNADGDLV